MCNLILKVVPALDLEAWLAIAGVERVVFNSYWFGFTWHQGEVAVIHEYWQNLIIGIVLHKFRPDCIGDRAGISRVGDHCHHGGHYTGLAWQALGCHCKLHWFLWALQLLQIVLVLVSPQFIGLLWLPYVASYTGALGTPTITSVCCTNDCNTPAGTSAASGSMPLFLCWLLLLLLFPS